MHDRPGVYEIYGRRQGSIVFFADELAGAAPNPTVYFTADSTKAPFLVDITRFDALASVVSGRFEGVRYEYYSRQDSVVITNARFDVNRKQ